MTMRGLRGQKGSQILPMSRLHALSMGLTIELSALPVEVPSSEGLGIVARYDGKQISDTNIHSGLE